jgi:hypothetical protein
MAAMNFFTAILGIVALGVIHDMYKARLKADSKGEPKMAGDINRRLDRIEERMSNVETVMLREERERDFMK